MLECMFLLIVYKLKGYMIQMTAFNLNTLTRKMKNQKKKNDQSCSCIVTKETELRNLGPSKQNQIINM